MKHLEEKNRRYYSSQIIPVTKENYLKILSLVYKRLRTMPIGLIVFVGFFLFPLTLFYYFIESSIFFSLTISLSSISLFYSLGPPLYVWTVYRKARKNHKFSFRKYGYLAEIDKDK